MGNSWRMTEKGFWNSFSSSRSFKGVTDCSSAAPCRPSLCMALISVTSGQPCSVPEITPASRTPGKSGLNPHLDGRCLQRFRVWVLKIWSVIALLPLQVGLIQLPKIALKTKTIEHIHTKFLIFTNTSSHGQLKFWRLFFFHFFCNSITVYPPYYLELMGDVIINV